MNRFEARAAAADDVECVWEALTDIANWPKWTTSISQVEGPGGTLSVGQYYRVTQPGMPRLTWEVTELVEGKSFTWVTASPGVRTVGSHWLSTWAAGSNMVHVCVEQSGPLSGLVWALTRRRTRRYLQMEANGLGAASRASARP